MSAAAPDRANRVVLVAPAYAETAAARALADDGGFERLLASARRVPGGRAPGRVVQSSEWPIPIRIRSGHRGGWLAPMLVDRHASPRRLEREWSIVSALHEAGAPVPSPVFAIARRAGLSWRTWIASEERTEACNAVEFFERRASSQAGRVRRRAARALGDALRRVHDAGVLHGDLNLRNVLFETTPAAETAAPRCLLIDFDRAQRRPSPSPRERMRELMRLVRSCEKEALTTSTRELACALAGYCRGDRTLRSALLADLPRERRRITRHRLLWPTRRRAAPRGDLGHTLVLCLAAVGAWLSVGCDPSPPVAPATTNDEARVRFFALGDTGRTRPFPTLFEGQHAVARAMRRQAARARVDALVLLGDNFYTDGLTRDSLVERVRANLVAPYCFLLGLDGPRSPEVAPACDVRAEDRMPARVYAVLGNHDLETEGSAELQREAVPEFVPDWRMPRGLAETIPLAEGVDLILFESEPRIDDPDAIFTAVRDAIRASEGPWRILAAHRPIATDDLGRPRLGGYPQFVLDAIAAAERPVQLVLAGHHHNLQVFEVGPPTPSLQLGLGSGARAEPPLASADHPAARFGRIAHGFAQVELVGRGVEARLVATLFETAALPILDRFEPEQVAARYAVDVHGRVEALPPSR